MKHASLIQELLSQNLPYSEIIKQTGATKSTISFHAKKNGGRARTPATNVQVEEAKQFITDGHSNSDIATWTDTSLSTICKLRKQLGISGRNLPNNPVGKIVDWIDVQAFHDSGATISQCARKYGFTRSSWYKAVARGEVSSKEPYLPTSIPLESILVEQSTYARGHLKNRLIKLNILPNECSVCKAPPEWQGRPLVLALDHKNGVNNDNRLENLRLLCPNCHSQTETFSGRNVRRRDAALPICDSVLDLDESASTSR